MEDACGQKHINHVVQSLNSHCRLTTKPKFSAPTSAQFGLAADEKVAYELWAFVYPKGMATAYSWDCGRRRCWHCGVSRRHCRLPCGSRRAQLGDDLTCLCGQPERPDAGGRAGQSYAYLVDEPVCLRGASLNECFENNISFFGAKSVSVRVAVSVFRMSSIRLRGVGQSGRIRSSSAKTSFPRADTLRPGSRRSSSLKKYAPGSVAAPLDEMEAEERGTSAVSKLRNRARRLL